MPGQKNRGKARDRHALEEGAKVGKLKGTPKGKRPPPPKGRQRRVDDPAPPVKWPDLAPQPEPGEDASDHQREAWRRAEEARWAQWTAREALEARLGVDPYTLPPLQRDGRTRFTAAHYGAVLDLMADGWLLRRIGRAFAGLPNYRAVYERAEADVEGYAAQFARAEALLNRALEEGIAEIADDGTNDWNEVFDKDGRSIGWQVNREHVTRSALRVRTHLDLLKIRDRSRYGDKVDVDAQVATTVIRKTYARNSSASDADKKRTGGHGKA